MIRVHRIDGMEILLNTDLIQSVEKGRQAVIHLVTGDKLEVKTSDRDVLEKIQAYRKGKRQSQKENKKKGDGSQK